MIRVVAHWIGSLPTGRNAPWLPASQRTVVDVTLRSGRVIRAYVRENLHQADSFVRNSGARLRHGIEGPGGATQEVLELAAPRAHWAELAAAIEAADVLGRRVRHGMGWDVTVAEAEHAARLQRVIERIAKPRGRVSIGELRSLVLRDSAEQQGHTKAAAGYAAIAKLHEDGFLG